MEGGGGEGSTERLFCEQYIYMQAIPHQGLPLHQCTRRTAWLPRSLGQNPRFPPAVWPPPEKDFLFLKEKYVGLDPDLDLDRILLFSSVAFKMPTKNKFFFAFYFLKVH
jgi:hypothetical protein